MSGVVDVHSHVIPARAVARMQEVSPEAAPRLIPPADGEGATLIMGSVRYTPFQTGGYNLEARLRYLDARGIDLQVISPVPFIYGYDLERDLGVAFARIQNEEIAAWVAAHPDRLAGLATLPMQDPAAAATELRRAIQELGLRGAILGTHVNGANLDAPELEPVWQAAEENNAFIFLHPWQVAGASRLQSYYLTNVVGNPFETTIAAASLVYGGVMQRHPGLTVCLPHGGGFVPYQRGRIEHAWQVQSQARQVLGDDPPGPYLDRFYLDSILFSPAVLEFVVRSAGADRVLLGSDFPFGMGEDDPVRALGEAHGLTEEERTRILGKTARRLLGTG